MDSLGHSTTRRERKREKRSLWRRRCWVNLQCLAALAAVGLGLLGTVAAVTERVQSGEWRLGWIQSAGRPAAWNAGQWLTGGGVRLGGGPKAPEKWLQEIDAGKSSDAAVSRREWLKIRPATRLQVDLPSRTLRWWRDGMLVKEYPVAVGSPVTPTPLGRYVIGQKERDPWWYPPPRLRQRGAAVTPSGPANPLGYRWMGFGNAYGIHGTNAPWYIGAAVSNGCIRMNEADVEELFEEVEVNTPLDITYEPVRVEVGRSGEVSAAVYPDLYGYLGMEGLRQELRRRLAEQKLAGLMPEALERRLVREQNGQPVIFARVVALKINGTEAERWSVVSGDEPLMPLWGIASALQISRIEWDGQKKEARCDGRSVPGVLLGEVVYLRPAAVQALFGGFWRWRPQERLLELAVPAFSRRYQPGEDIPALSASELPFPPGNPDERAASARLRR